METQLTGTGETPYERQMRILQQPDGMATYFSSEEQRQLVGTMIICQAQHKLT